MGNKIIGGVPETMIITLWAKAEESKKDYPIIWDEKAKEVIKNIDYDFSKFQSSWRSQVGVCIRSKLMDTRLHKFLAENPEACVINLGAGLDTRLSRINNFKGTWYNIDLPEGISLREQFLSENENVENISSSALKEDWIKQIQINHKQVFIIAEGLLMYFDENQVRSIFNMLANSFPGAEMIFDVIPPFLVGKGKMHDSVKSMDTNVEFKWGEKDIRVIEKWNKRIKVKDSWSLFNYEKEKWGFMGKILSILCLKSLVDSRVVQIKFAK
jgi:O-methyltransferase involved in polyketide biosynthesis